MCLSRCGGHPIRGAERDARRMRRGPSIGVQGRNCPLLLAARCKPRIAAFQAWLKAQNKPCTVKMVACEHALLELVMASSSPNASCVLPGSPHTPLDRPRLLFQRKARAARRRFSRLPPITDSRAEGARSRPQCIEASELELPHQRLAAGGTWSGLVAQVHERQQCCQGVHKGQQGGRECALQQFGGVQR